jgi:hypothetical protein
MATELSNVLKAADPTFDVSKFTYQLALPPETLPPIYPKFEPPVTQPPAVAAQPLYPVTQTGQPTYTVQMTAEQHARYLQLSTEPPKQPSRPSIISRIRNRLESIAPNFISFEDDEVEDTDFDPVDCPVQPGFREPTYASRYPVATAPPAVPSPPQSARQPTVSTPRSIGLYQKIGQHYSAVQLKAEGVTVADLMAADVRALDLRRAGYTLDEVGHLVPELEFLVKMGLDRSMLDEKWRIPVLADVYKLPVASVCQYFNLNVRDLSRSGMGLTDIASAGFTLNELIRMGANFDFIYSLRSPPDLVSSLLKGSFSDLDRLNFNETQKRKLSRELGWTPQAMIGCFGLTTITSSSCWMPMKDSDLFGWQLNLLQ